ncbi:MAG: hypothetical protein NVS9B3_16170 [Gemmatimonadaceae bacterium]
MPSLRWTLPLLGALTLAIAACRASRPGAPPPGAEFLVAAGDSTFWVTSDSGGVRVRTSPMLLAHYAGKFTEIYTIDDDRSFYDAIFVGQRLYRRDVATGDSTLIFADTVIPALARAYGVAHPKEKPLVPEDDASDDPVTVASAELNVTELHGPYVSFEYRAQIRTADDRGGGVARRGVLDLRTGERATLSRVFGAGVARRVVASGRRAFAAAIDSIAAVPDKRAQRAAQAASELRFDSASFALVDVKREPAVEFVLSGTSDATRGLTLPLAPIQTGSVSWWADARETLPTDGENGASRWVHAGYEVLARHDSSTGRATLAIRNRTSRREWKVGRLPSPVIRIYWLDSPPLDSLSRRALGHAFDESLFYSEDARSASNIPTPRSASGSIAARSTSHSPTPRGAASRIVPAAWSPR